MRGRGRARALEAGGPHLARQTDRTDGLCWTVGACGGSGLVSEATVAVTPGDTIAVTVGAAGTGANEAPGNEILGNTPGGTSSFGALLSAAGGSTVTSLNAPGANGGSGGGGSGNSGSPGGAGGTNGTNGFACTYQGGTGQGSFAALFAPMVRATFTAGSGGAGGTSSHAGGGGGGGVLLDGAGPSGAKGGAAYSAEGGAGYGGGGGGGGYSDQVFVRIAGGNGAPGLVYVELVTP